MSISMVLNLVLEGRGELLLRPYLDIRNTNINDLILWSGSDKYGFEREVRFGDELWKPIGEKVGVKFDGIDEIFKYEIKILSLSLYSQGVAQGMPPLKWSTVVGGIRVLRSFSFELSMKGLNSFSELKNFPSLKLRNVFKGICFDLGVNEKPRLASAVVTSFQWLFHYGLISPREKAIVGEVLLLAAEHHKSISKKNHSVIPTPVLKKLITAVTQEITSIKIIVHEWIIAQDEQMMLIKGGKYIVKNGRYKSIGPPISEGRTGLLAQLARLPALVNILVLAFTGMRDGEAFYLKNDSVIRKKIGGKKIFFIRTELSKTTDGSQTLEWICNELTADAVDFLVSVNLVVHKKAKLILEHLDEEISAAYRNELNYGIGDNRLFSVSYSIATCSFLMRSKRPKSGAFDIAGYFKISVEYADIQQLIRLSSNCKSVSPTSSERLKEYVVGDFFNFTPHQFRHTFAWFIIANKLGELDDIRYQYKHLWESMTLVYAKRGFESIGELLNIADSFAEQLTHLTVEELVDAALDEKLTGKGGERFSRRIKEMLGNQYTDSLQPHFKDVGQLVEFVSKHSGDLRGLSHGYCTKAMDCKVKNVADPSHCIYCDGYIASERHLPHWKAIKNNCEAKLMIIENSDTSLKPRLEAFKTALEVNLEGANQIIRTLDGKLRGQKI